MIKITKNLIILVIAVIIVGVAAYFFFGQSKNNISVGAGKIADVKTMAQLCTIEIFNEVPVKDTINNKMLFGIQKQQGSISFDMEKMEINADGDTVKITLSPEIVEINEATADNSWQVIDTKGLSLFTSNKLTDEE
ncbi:MAG: hypothetical protein K2K97_03625, partial [Muribaculaceae bacterium]|nr:hypothetical protein [Muribaculaceae bacterium]